MCEQLSPMLVTCAVLMDATTVTAKAVILAFIVFQKMKIVVVVGLALFCTYGTAQFKVDKARVWHVLDMTRFLFRTRAGMRALARLMM